MKQKGISLLLVAALLLAVPLSVAAEDTDPVASAGAIETVAYSQANPAPVGTPQKVWHSTRIWEYEATVTINSVLRGEAAWEQINASNKWNPAPPDGMEYILANITVSVQYAKNYLHYYFNEKSFTIFSTEDIEYKNYRPHLFVFDNAFRGNVFPGGTLSGYAVFLVNKMDPHSKVVIGGGYITRNGSWFSLG